MNAGRLIRWATAGVVLAVGSFAAVISYSHVYSLGRAHGQVGLSARLLPLSVDGLILAASLVMLAAARQGQPVPVLARCMLGLGVAATVGANILYGLPWGLLGAVVSAWPAVAFIGSAEMLIGMIRASGGTPVPPVPASEDTALAAYRASVAAGEPLSARQLAAQHGISRRIAGYVVQQVARESNGHG